MSDYGNNGINNQDNQDNCYESPINPIDNY